LGGEQGLDLSCHNQEEKLGFSFDAPTYKLAFDCPTRGKNPLAGQIAHAVGGKDYNNSLNFNLNASLVNVIHSNLHWLTT